MTQPPAPAKRRNLVAILAVAAVAILVLIGAVFLGAKFFGGDNGTTNAAATSPAAASTSPSPAASPSPAPAMGAKAVVDALAAAGLPLTKIAEQNEDTDPNNKIGRPGGYVSRASADVPGGDKEARPYDIDRGLVVEVFATVAEADARADYIQEMRQATQMFGTEYQYRPADRRILVRLTGKVKPSQAKKYETAVSALAS